MAENQEQMQPKEREIPVFTVSKNNFVLKNIFLLDHPPSIPSSSWENVDIEEVLVVGRHPDCNIKLEHPSISRFHLRIQSKPSSRSLFATDLSSVHGTWVSGRRIEPGVRTKVNEGDTLQLGASTRLYRLNWVPLSRAYDIDDLFVPPLDAPDAVHEELDQDGDSVSYGNKSLSDNVEGLQRLFSEDLYEPFSYKDELENHVSEMDNKENELSGRQICQLDVSVTVEEETEGAADQDGNNLSDDTEGLEWLFTDENLVLSAQTSATAPPMPEELYYSFPEKDDEIFSPDDKENMNSQVKFLFDGSVLKDHQYASSDNDDEIFTPDKENTSPKSYLVRSLKCKFEETLKGDSISNSPISSLNQDKEIFTPDKENMTSDSRLPRPMKNMGRSGEVNRLNLYRPSPLKIANNENMYREEVLQESKSAFSVTKNHGILKKQQQPAVKARADRKPFCPLPVISTSDRKGDSVNSVHESTKRSCRSINYLDPEDVNQSYKNTRKVIKSRWTIIADTTCLLNRKSRNELQLLRGLRGTTLIIPRIVVRELDRMLRRASFFSRMTEASAALSWIEECMAKTKWWIHVQSSAEEGRMVPPTPITASHWFSDDKGPFSPYTLQEIVTPTPADHILECALLFRRTANGQLVLLSDDVTLKIKAMAEGVICETVQEFRRSVVNPFSSRFLYSESSPIGPTWSCFDDTVLKENYYPSPVKNSKSGESARGLKLILLHNSTFRQITI